MSSRSSHGESKLITTISFCFSARVIEILNGRCGVYQLLDLPEIQSRLQPEDYCHTRVSAEGTFSIVLSRLFSREQMNGNGGHSDCEAGLSKALQERPGE